VNIFAILTIYSCMMSIIGIFVGDRILNYFQLEQKFPRAAKYLKLRQKLQLYYFIKDTSLIFIMIIMILSFNIFVLFKDIIMS
jgi:hypothetical protein